MIQNTVHRVGGIRRYYVQDFRSPCLIVLDEPEVLREAPDRALIEGTEVESADKGSRLQSVVHGAIEIGQLMYPIMHDVG